VVIVETVGVGQSETAVAGMTDCFVLLALPNAGDDLQAIKRGIVELVDFVLVNKADIDPKAAELARTQIANAFSMLRQRAAHWSPPVLALSALSGAAVEAFWGEAERFRAAAAASGAAVARRKAQAVDWMIALVEHELRARLPASSRQGGAVVAVQAAVAEGRMTPAAAAARLLASAKH
jgi:LAO/AO transport system kinase